MNLSVFICVYLWSIILEVLFYAASSEFGISKFPETKIPASLYS
ncbi:hypothetical protein [Aphanizomenon sp. UHCC 0183]|nr:hypothetical protein [Aphanizomenon sp. UHCC 0183]